MYSHDDFDLAGFSVGAVNRNGLLPRGSDIREDDVIIGLGSSGVHSNGFSLVRKILAVSGKSFQDAAPFAKHMSLGEALLVPTKIYVKTLMPVIKMGYIKALAHITGGGLLDNIPRILPKEFGVELDANTWQMPPVFQWLRKEGNVKDNDMLRTFNCGLGMVCIVAPEVAGNVVRALHMSGEPDAFVVGKVTKRKDVQVVINNFSESISTTNVRTSEKRVAVLISGSGTNLQALLDHTLDKRRHSAAKIVVVISNVPDVEGLRRAERAGIPTKVIPHKGLKRVDFDMLVHQVLTEFDVELVCLAGFMRLLSSEFVRLWEGRLINVHPSLLPAFKGMNTHEEVLNAGVRIHGCTVHFVDEGLDTGSIILQEAVPVLLNDTPSTLQERVKLQGEHKIYPLALEHLARGDVGYNSQLKKTEWHVK